jgi:transcriptional regulator with XRE-family HTH domain
MAKSSAATAESRSQSRSHRLRRVPLRRFLRISQEEFARLLGVSVRTVTRWEGEGIRPKAGLRELIDYMLRLTRRLDELLDRKHIIDWLTTPNPEFLGQPPMDLIQSQYGRKVLENELERAEWGIPG